MRGIARENHLGFYSLRVLIALLVVRACGLVFGFALLHEAGSQLSDPTGPVGYWTEFHHSGTTFFMLGLGDLAPVSAVERALTVVEAGSGSDSWRS